MQNNEKMIQEYLKNRVNELREENNKIGLQQYKNEIIIEYLLNKISDLEYLEVEYKEKAKLKCMYNLLEICVPEGCPTEYCYRKNTKGE